MIFDIRLFAFAAGLAFPLPLMISFLPRIFSSAVCSIFLQVRSIDVAAPFDLPLQVCGGSSPRPVADHSSFRFDLSNCVG